jgi:hypothetical protein
MLPLLALSTPVPVSGKRVRALPPTEELRELAAATVDAEREAIFLRVYKEPDEPYDENMGSGNEVEPWGVVGQEEYDGWLDAKEYWGEGAGRDKMVEAVHQARIDGVTEISELRDVMERVMREAPYEMDDSGDF